MRDYYLGYTPSNYLQRDKIRKIMLVISIFLDCIAIALFVTAIFMPLYFIAVVLLPIISNIIRYLVNIYPKKYNYGIYQGKFEIYEITPLRTHCILSKDISDINEISKVNNEIEVTNSENALILFNNSCYQDVYMLLFSDKCVVVDLDEYLYTLLKHDKRG